MVRRSHCLSHLLPPILIATWGTVAAPTMWSRTVTHLNRSSLGFPFYFFYFLHAVLLVEFGTAAKLFIYMLIPMSCPSSVLWSVHREEWNIAGVVQSAYGSACSSFTGNIFFTVGNLSLSFFCLYLYHTMSSLFLTCAGGVSDGSEKGMNFSRNRREEATSWGNCLSILYSIRCTLNPY